MSTHIVLGRIKHIHTTPLGGDAQNLVPRFSWISLIHLFSFADFTLYHLFISNFSHKYNCFQESCETLYKSSSLRCFLGTCETHVSCLDFLNFKKFFIYFCITIYPPIPSSTSTQLPTPAITRLLSMFLTSLFFLT